MRPTPRPKETAAGVCAVAARHTNWKLRERRTAREGKQMQEGHRPARTPNSKFTVVDEV